MIIFQTIVYTVF